MPTTRSACVVAAPIAAIESEDVLVARIASRSTTPSSAANNVRFTERSSTTASMTSPHSANAPTPRDVAPTLSIRARSASARG